MTTTVHDPVCGMDIDEHKILVIQHGIQFIGSDILIRATNRRDRFTGHRFGLATYQQHYTE